MHLAHADSRLFQPRTEFQAFPSQVHPTALLSVPRTLEKVSLNSGNIVNYLCKSSRDFLTFLSQIRLRLDLTIDYFGLIICGDK